MPGCGEGGVSAAVCTACSWACVLWYARERARLWHWPSLVHLWQAALHFSLASDLFLAAWVLARAAAQKA